MSTQETTTPHHHKLITPLPLASNLNLAWGNNLLLISLLPNYLLMTKFVTLVVLVFYLPMEVEVEKQIIVFLVEGRVISVQVMGMVMLLGLGVGFGKVIFVEVFRSFKSL